MRSVNRESQNAKFLPTVGFKLSVMLLDPISIKHFKVDRLLPECAINIPRGRCSKIFCHVLQVINALQSANILISQIAK